MTKKTSPLSADKRGSESALSRLVLVVSGGIAAYKVPPLCRALRARDFDLRVVATKNALRFVTKDALAQASGAMVACDLFSHDQDCEDMAHIRLARWGQGVLIVPATANFLARLAHGLCDDLGTALLAALERHVPVFAAPAMNPQMWQNPANVANVAVLQRRGVQLLGPCVGRTACDEVGVGRLLEPLEIAEHMESFRTRATMLAGKRVLITAGATREAIDPVRFLSNRSSGKQGFALARAFAESGAEVRLVAGVSSVPPPASPRITTVLVESAEEMARACRAACDGTQQDDASFAAPLDVAVCAAAVADFRARKPSQNKPAKREVGCALALAPTPDILAEFQTMEEGLRPRLVVGFAAETEAIASAALASKQQAKKKAKGCDWLIANDVSDNKVFGAEVNRVQLLDETGKTEVWDSMTKERVARRIVAKTARWLKAQGELKQGELKQGESKQNKTHPPSTKTFA